MQSQIVCNGCRSLLLYPRGASNVCCALCNTITPVPAPPPVATAMDMAQLVCGGCRTLLMHARGASTVRCSCCHTLSLAQAHVNCGNCRTTLMYPSGAPSVKCAICHYITNVCMPNMRVPLPVNRPNGTNGTVLQMPNMRVPLPVNRPNGTNGTVPSTSSSMPHTQTQTVVVENPMSVDESGKLVSNVVVGVTTEKK